MTFPWLKDAKKVYRFLKLRLFNHDDLYSTTEEMESSHSLIKNLRFLLQSDVPFANECLNLAISDGIRGFSKYRLSQAHTREWDERMNTFALSLYPNLFLSFVVIDWFREWRVADVAGREDLWAMANLLGEVGWKKWR